MDTVLAVFIGLGLSAACGFRIFVPLLVLSIASAAGALDLAEDFQWLSSMPAIIALSVATVLEVLAYFIPGVDHALDVLAAPVSVVAGTVAVASVVTDMSPFLRWMLAIIAGGGTAGLVQGLTSTTRVVSAVKTAGFGNPVVAGAEAGGAIVLSVMSIAAPIAAAVIAVLLAVFAFRAGRTIFRRFRRSHAGGA